MKAVAGTTFVVWALGVPLLWWWIATSIFHEVRLRLLQPPASHGHHAQPTYSSKPRYACLDTHALIQLWCAPRQVGGEQLLKRRELIHGEWDIQKTSGEHRRKRSISYSESEGTTMKVLFSDTKEHAQEVEDSKINEMYDEMLRKASYFHYEMRLCELPFAKWFPRLSVDAAAVVYTIRLYEMDKHMWTAIEMFERLCFVFMLDVLLPAISWFVDHYAGQCKSQDAACTSSHDLLIQRIVAAGLTVLHGIFFASSLYFRPYRGRYLLADLMRV